MTRNEIAEATGIRLSSVCGRVAELMEEKSLHDGQKRTCTITGELVHVVDFANQLQMPF